MKRALPIVVLLLVAAAVWLVVRSPPPSETSRSHAAQGASAAPDDLAESNPHAIAAAPVEARDAGFAAPDHTVRDRATRDIVRARIYRAWAEAMGTPPAQADPLHAPMPMLDGGNVDPNYLGERVREDFLPMAKACYEQFLERAPGQQGRVVMRFVILGNPHVGGVVDEAELDGADGGMGDGGTGDPEFATCLRESMMAMAFRPPPESGRVDVTFPFTFRPGDAGSPSR